jgi:hypothetical protein
MLEVAVTLLFWKSTVPDVVVIVVQVKVPFIYNTVSITVIITLTEPIVLLLVLKVVLPTGPLKIGDKPVYVPLPRDKSPHIFIMVEAGLPV